MQAQAAARAGAAWFTAHLDGTLEMSGLLTDSALAAGYAEMLGTSSVVVADRLRSYEKPRFSVRCRGLILPSRSKKPDS